MLLLQIKNDIKHSKFIVDRIYNYKKLNEKLKKNKTIVENFANTKVLITAERFPGLNASDLIKYVLGVSFLKKNIIMYIGSANGQLKYHCSAGFIKLSKNQKVKIPLVLIKLTKIVSIKLPSLTDIPTALHLNNVPKSLQLFFEPVFKTQFLIVQLNSFKLFSHNGCRPKKLKRKKRKKIFFG
jgi:hypothetical protein